MNSRIELESNYIAERLRSERVSAARRRLVSHLTPGGLQVVARPLGQALLGLGARLMRYATPEPDAYVGGRAAELN